MLVENTSSFIGQLADNVHYYPARNNLPSKATGTLIVNRLGNQSDKYDAIPFVAWGAYADRLHQYSSKGKQMQLKGPLRTKMVPAANPGGKPSLEFYQQVNWTGFGEDSNYQRQQTAAAQVQPAQQTLTELSQEVKREVTVRPAFPDVDDL